jgi:hypothetical protein
LAIDTGYFFIAWIAIAAVLNWFVAGMHVDQARALAAGFQALAAFAALCFIIYAVVKRKVVSRKEWIFAGAALVFWFISDALLAGYEWTNHQPAPFPGVAEWFWLAGYVPLLVMLFKGVLQGKESATTPDATLLLLVLLLADLLALNMLLVPLMQTPTPFMAKLFDALFIIGDLAVFALALFAAGLSRDFVNSPYTGLAGAAALLLVAHGALLSSLLNGTFSPGGIPDFLGLVTYGAFAYSALKSAQK